MKIGKQQDEKIIVRILSATRVTEGKNKGKIKYETFESFDVYEAQPEKVYKIAFEAVRDAK